MTHLNTQLVSELRTIADAGFGSGHYGVALRRAADALESNSRALNEKEAELASLEERFAHLLAAKDAHAEKRFEATERAETAERERDEALAALKASEERETATIEAGRDLLSYLALFDFNDRDPGEELPEHMARLTAALFARSALENRPSTLADATNPATDFAGRAPTSSPCLHAPTYDAGLCCGHPDDCTFVSPSNLSKEKDDA